MAITTTRKTQEDSPDVVAVGPKIGAINPNISVTVQQTNQKTLVELMSEKIESLKLPVEAGNLKVLQQKPIIVNGNDAYLIEAIGLFSYNDKNIDVKFKEITIYDVDKFYTISYSNGLNDFDSQLPRFDETINSFEILSQDNSNDGIMNETSSEETGGCLIATATFGSELAPQVQQLRELRDNSLLNTESGTAFMESFNKIYYSFSPIIADYERENPVFKEAVKLTLTPMLSSLSILNYVDMDSESSVLGYGIGIILMNAGMYFVVPALIIYKIRK